VGPVPEPSEEIVEALRRLDALTRRLRAQCPWDREQDERSIVPHTVEEAYELAAAAHSGDDAKLLEERAAGSLGAVAEHVHAKLVRRHPHIFGEVPEGRPEGGQPDQDDGPDARRGNPLSAGQVLRNWDAIKQTEAGREPGIFGEVPENLPGPLYARKVQRRAASTGFDFEHIPYEAVEAELDELREAGTREEAFHEVGDVLFAAVNLARKLKVDPELALRAAADRFRGRVQGAEALAASEGTDWNDLGTDDQIAYYARARLNEEF
jgi:uncharacterized protein YabN with tetrapyrrole methylase and pyrophosphatase domain